MTNTREQILDNIKTSLEAIDGTSPYSNTVRIVSRDLRTPQQMPTRPAVCIISGDERPVLNTTPERLFFTMDVSLLCYYDATPGTDNDTAANSLFADVKYAMIVDANRTRGGKATATWPQGMSPVSVESQGVRGFVCTFTVDYNHTWSQP